MGGAGGGSKTGEGESSGEAVRRVAGWVEAVAAAAVATAGTSAPNGNGGDDGEWRAW